MAVPMNAGDAQTILALIGAFGAIVPGLSLAVDDFNSEKTKLAAQVLLAMCIVFMLPGVIRLWTIALLGA
jgi:hypothetical protein